MSSRTIVINPDFEHLREFVSNMPNIFDGEGECIYDKRNQIKVFDHNGLRINVKRFQIPPLLFNRVIYRLLRAPKAVRAYDYAFKLLDLGIDTPMPIAHIVYGNACLLGYSYFVSIHEPFTHDIGDYEDGREVKDEDIKILQRFGEFTAKLHNSEVYHRDYGAGNILFKMVEGEPKFYLLDNNRMNFKPVTLRKGCGSFRRLVIDKKTLRYITDSYAKARGCDAEYAIEEAVKARQRYVEKMRLKRLRKFKL